MKARKSVLWFVCGILLGVTLTLCLGAADKSAEPQKKDWSKLKPVSFSSGVMGLFDPDSGRMYLYDINLVNCYAIRELTALGEPMTRIKN